MTRPLAALAGLLALAAVPAAAQGPADPSPAAVRPGTYKVESSHTRILWSVSHLGFSTWYGDFTGVQGQLMLDPKAPARDRLELTLPTGSVSTTNAKLDGELKSPDWFDAARYPTIRFVSTRVAPTAPGRADVTGDLTFHGVTKPVTLHVRFNGAGVSPISKAYTAGFDASATLKRSDYGVKTYVPLVGDEVTLQLSGAFEQAGG